MLTFAHLWIIALLPLPWLLRRILPVRKLTKVAVRVPFGSRLRAAMADRAVSKVTHKTRRQLIPGLIWLLILVSLAHPQWLEEPISKELPTRDLLLLVDLSGSMRQEDFTNTAGKTVDRLTAVKEVLGDFLMRRKGDRIGLVVFGDSPFLQSPFSTDLNLSAQLLDETAIGMAGGRTAFGDAIGLGITLFEQSETPEKTIIALTDGNDTKSQVPPIEAARIAKEQHIRIHTVAIGDPATAGEEKLDEATLREVAETTTGSYFFAADHQQLTGIYEELDRIETGKVNTISHRPRRDLFYWPLLTAVLLSLFEKVLWIVGNSSGSRPLKASGLIRVNPITGKLELDT